MTQPKMPLPKMTEAAELALRDLAVFKSLQILIQLCLRIGVGLASAILCFGCSTFPFSSSRGDAQKESDSRRIQYLQRTVRSQQKKLDAIRDRNLVLEQRLKKERVRTAQVTKREIENSQYSTSLSDRPLAEKSPPFEAVSDNEYGHRVPIPFDPSAALNAEGEGELAPVQTSVSHQAVGPKIPLVLPPKIKAAKNPVMARVTKNSVMKPAVDRPLAPPVAQPAVAAAVQAPAVVSVPQEQTGEHYLYSKVLETYRLHDSASLGKTLQLLLKTYPDSVFADNSLYLAGLLAMETNHSEQAKGYMQRLIQQYPGGNKVVAALFTEAVIEKRAKNFARARRIFEEVARLFPGSPEAARVEFELKLLKTSAKARQGV